MAKENSMKMYITNGFMDEAAANATDEIAVPVAALTRSIPIKDKQGDPWTALIGWTEEDGRLTPTTIVLQSQTGKTVTRALLAGLEIGKAVDDARAKEAKNLKAHEAFLQRIAYPAASAWTPPEIADKHKATGRPMQYGESFHRLVADAWFADRGDSRGVVRRIGDRLWKEGGELGGWGMGEASFHSRVRKAMKRLKDPNDPWGFIADAQQPSTKTTGKKKS